MVTTHQNIHDRLGVELVWVQRIESSVVFYEDLDVTCHNAILLGL
jgi:hypothetical protein